MSEDGWSREELKASVEAYLHMLDGERKGQRVIKTEIYRGLAAQFGRTVKAYEFRMQNISYVLNLQGRAWIQGLKPAKNVGANVATVIEQILAEIEGSERQPIIESEIAVAENVQKKVTEKPSGNVQPGTTLSTVTQFQRDPAVKAWVLQHADGRCECCSAEAPFVRADGMPYLEVHHVRQLVDGGSDTIENTVAICPNCHRELHYGIKAHSIVAKLYEQVPRLVRE